MLSKKELTRLITLKVVPLLASVLIKSIYFTCRKSFRVPTSLPKEPILMAFWHAELLFQPLTYHKVRENPKAVVIISDHFDGKLIANITNYFRIGVIHGSSNRSASRVLIQAIKHLKNGYDVGITPDGPRGPRHKVANGIIIMAQKTNSKIALLSTKPESYWQLKSWDKFMIPKPFSRIEFVVSEAFDVSSMSLEDAKEFIEEKMLENGR